MATKPHLRILVAPLNWGLGHAVRCIPIIKHLLAQGHHVCIASDGKALELLQQEFPKLKIYPLTCSKATYARSKFSMKYKLGLQAFKLIKKIKKEQRLLAEIRQKEGLDLIISDNRIGLRLADTPSVIITHQLTVLSGKSSWLTTAIHAYYLKKFDSIWIPDRSDSPQLSGILSKNKRLDAKAKYIGIPSRMTSIHTEKIYKYAMILSGPEPLRTEFEQRLIAMFKTEVYPTILIQGKVEANKTKHYIGSIEVYNYMTSEELNLIINQAECIICRSGYTSVLDLAKLGAKGFLVPTPGQYEQEYLAQHLKQKGLADFCLQNNLSLKRIKNAQSNGFSNYKVSPLQIDLDLKVEA